MMDVAAHAALISGGYNNHVVAVVLRCFQVGEVRVPR
jgi:hypothetical protein